MQLPFSKSILILLSLALFLILVVFYFLFRVVFAPVPIAEIVPQTNSNQNYSPTQRQKIIDDWRVF